MPNFWVHLPTGIWINLSLVQGVNISKQYGDTHMNLWSGSEPDKTQPSWVITDSDDRDYLGRVLQKYEVFP